MDKEASTRLELRHPREPHDNSLFEKRDSRPDGKNTNHTECKSHAKEEKSRRSQSIETDNNRTHRKNYRFLSIGKNR